MLNDYVLAFLQAVDLFRNLQSTSLIAWLLSIWHLSAVGIWSLANLAHFTFAHLRYFSTDP